MSGRKIIFLFLVAILYLSCEIEKCIRYNLASINDYKIFPFHTTQASITKFQFFCTNSSDLRLPKYFTDNKQNIPFEEFLKSKSVIAFLVIHNDSIVYENYFKSYTASTPVPSFSIAKSITATLIGCAIDDGYIKSTNDKIIDYLPELEKNGFNKIRIKNLLQMTSGIKFKESYMAIFKGIPTYYYGKNLRKKISKLKLKSEPGKEFEYKSADSQLLGLVLEKAIKPKTITEYLQEKIWQPLGMEYDATWSIDNEKDGIEKTFCCLNARARDFAKFGRLYLNKGNWDGKQIVSTNWINQCTTVDTCIEAPGIYQNSWWIASNKGDFFSKGLLGQYVYVNPEKNLIIVRLGEKSAKVDWLNVFCTISNKF
jgi:CubicO group peptidase (beta-lactamase class C family)